MTKKDLSQELKRIHLLIEEENPTPFFLRGVSELEGETLKEKVDHFFLMNREVPSEYENEEAQCPSGRRRSLGDVFIIMKYYVPELKIRNLVRVLYELGSVNDRTIAIQYCDVISKRVFRYASHGNGFNYGPETDDEYGNTWEFYTDVYENLPDL